MKLNLLLLLMAVFFSTGLFSQTQPIKVTPVVVANNPVKAIPLKMADTTSLKIKKLQEDNQKQQLELATLKMLVVGLNNTVTALQETVGDLKTKYNQDHVELGIAKLSLKSITGSQLPAAYASFSPVKGTLGGYQYKLATQYGVVGEPVQIYGSVTITLSHSFEQTPVIVTALGENQIDTQLGRPLAVVTYEFIAPNKLRLTVDEIKGTMIGPFSVAVFGK